MALSDRRIFQLAKKRVVLKSQAKDASVEVTKIDRKLLDEFQRRDTKLIESPDGWYVRIIQPESVMYDDEALLAALKPAQRRIVTKRVLDVAALSREVQAGNISADLVARFTTVRKSQPYIMADQKDS